jgi:uncharacterized small protein (DUF1192 family)
MQVQDDAHGVEVLLSAAEISHILEVVDAELQRLKADKAMLEAQKVELRALFPSKLEEVRAALDKDNIIWKQLSEVGHRIGQVDARIVALNDTDQKLKCARDALAGLRRSPFEDAEKQEGQEPKQKRNKPCRWATTAAVLAALTGAGWLAAPHVSGPLSAFVSGPLSAFVSGPLSVRLLSLSHYC